MFSLNWKPSEVSWSKHRFKSIEVVVFVCVVCILVYELPAQDKLPAQVVLEASETVHNAKESPEEPVSPKPAEKDATERVPPPAKLTLPIPVGHEVKGIRVPYYDVYGVKQLDFFAKQARRVDEDVIRMTDAEIEFFNDVGERDMKVTLPSAVFNFSTQILGSDQPSKIQRADFIVTGSKLVFHVPDKRGRLIGKVRMYVFDKDQLGAHKSKQP